MDTLDVSGGSFHLILAGAWHVYPVAFCCAGVQGRWLNLDKRNVWSGRTKHVRWSTSIGVVRQSKAVEVGNQQASSELEAAVISLVGARGQLSRSDIAKLLGISAASVTNATKRLLHQDVLREVGKKPSDGGRPLVLLEINQEQRFALGVKLTPNHIVMAKTDMNGHISTGVSLDVNMCKSSAFDEIADVIKEYIRPFRRQLLGIGVAVPGRVDPGNPDVLNAPTLGWENKNFGRHLRRQTDLPVVIDNDVNALAVAEKLYQGTGSESTLLVTIGYGIGAAITVEGKVLHGAHGAAAELGHTAIDDSDEPCVCGLKGCLETYISDDSLVRRAREMRILTPSQGKRHLNTMAESGDAQALALFCDAGEKLGVAVANLVQLCDPAAMTISGEGVDMWHHWEPGFSAALRRRTASVYHDLPITVQPWSEDMWAYGAASLVFAQPLGGC